MRAWDSSAVERQELGDEDRNAILVWWLRIRGRKQLQIAATIPLIHTQTLTVVIRIARGVPRTLLRMTLTERLNLLSVSVYHNFWIVCR